MDILFVVLYAIFIGFYNVCKKLSVVKSHQAATMVLFTSTAFILSLLWIPFGVLIPWRFVWLFVLKGFLLALSWFMILNILKTVDLTIVTVTDVLSAVLSFLLGIVLFQEIVSWLQIVGAILVVFSVAAINLCNRRKKGSANMLQIFCLIISALISSSSSVIAKQRLWLSMLISFGIGMLMFMMVPIITPLNSTIVNVLMCLAGSLLFSFGIGWGSKVILDKTSLV